MNAYTNNLLAVANVMSTDNYINIIKKDVLILHYYDLITNKYGEKSPKKQETPEAYKELFVNEGNNI